MNNKYLFLFKLEKQIETQMMNVQQQQHEIEKKTVICIFSLFLF